MFGFHLLTFYTEFHIQEHQCHLVLYLTVITKKDLKERSKLSFCRAIGGSAVGFGFLAIVPKFMRDKNNLILMDIS